MRTLRLLATAFVGLAALFFAAMGVGITWAAFAGSSDTEGGVLIGIGCLLVAIALVVAWGARVTWYSGVRTQLLLLTAVGAFLAVFPINSVVGWPGYVLNAICGAVVAGALVALVFARSDGPLRD
jgi:hypothetical protein